MECVEQRAPSRYGDRTVRGNSSTAYVHASHRGLTLIEVLIVIAILLAIGGLVVVNLMPAKEGADRDIQRSQFDHVEGAMDMFKLNMKRYPSDEEGLAALTSKDAIENEEEA